MWQARTVNCKSFQMAGNRVLAGESVDVTKMSFICLLSKHYCWVFICLLSKHYCWVRLVCNLCRAVQTHCDIFNVHHLINEI